MLGIADGPSQVLLKSRQKTDFNLYLTSRQANYLLFLKHMKFRGIKIVKTRGKNSASLNKYFFPKSFKMGGCFSKQKGEPQIEMDFSHQSLKQIPVQVLNAIELRKLKLSKNELREVQLGIK